MKRYQTWKESRHERWSRGVVTGVLWRYKTRDVESKEFRCEKDKHQGISNTQHIPSAILDNPSQVNKTIFESTASSIHYSNKMPSEGSSKKSGSESPSAKEADTTKETPAKDTQEGHDSKKGSKSGSGSSKVHIY